MTNIGNLEIESIIYIVRGQRVILDFDLATLYGVETKVLNQAVKRNVDRFPEDFMMQLSEIEGKNLRSQIVTSSSKYGGRRHLTYAFTELGIAMLSSVLKSERAIQVNISIMRAFFELRKQMSHDQKLSKKLEKIERQSEQIFRHVFERIEKLEAKSPLLPPHRRKIGI